MIAKELRPKLVSGEDILTDVLGQETAKEQLGSALLVSRHTIIVGNPGIGKTTMAKNVAKLLPEIEVADCGYNCLPSKPVCPECKLNKSQKTKKIRGIERFVRVQGSPDLTSEDLLGDIDPIKALKFGPASLEAFTPGKIFAANNGILFFDEVNRCPEKLQNALLQVLEERKVTIGSYRIDLEADFIFIGTMNPQDSSTERLSEVFMDRFDLIYMHFPETQELEEEIVKQNGRKEAEFPDKLFQLMVSFVRQLRNNPKLSKVPSVRANLGLYERAQANALIRQRKIVEIEDITDAALSVLAHRIELKPSAKYSIGREEFVKEELSKLLEEQEISPEKGGYL